MAGDPVLVRFAPLALGPFDLGRLTATGLLRAAAFLASIKFGLVLARRRGVPPRLVIETHVLAAFAAAGLAHARALAAAFPAFLHDGRLLAGALLAPPDRLVAAAGTCAVIAAMAWASGRPRDLLDSLAPGAALVAAAAMAAVGADSLARPLLVLATCVAASALAWRLARRGLPGEAALVAAEACVVAGTLAWFDEGTLALAATAALLGVLVTVHVLLRARVAPVRGVAARR